MYVSHDATPDRAFACDGVRAESWNGWTVPYWTSPYGVAAALDGVVGDDASVMSVEIVGDTVVVTREGEGDETFTRGADGTFSGRGWTWVPAHRHEWRGDVKDWVCEDCGTVTDFCGQVRS